MTDAKKSISNIINDINSGKIFLPAIQRKYVWKDSQITRFMDSIMLDYPIATFLLWKVKKNTINDKGYSMYQFIKDYHERDMFKNPDAPQPFVVGSEEETVWAVLDGQQRLTSLYIALQGSVARKLPSKRWKNDDAFIKKELYFNLHSHAKNEDGIYYEFEFMTAEEAKQRNDAQKTYSKDLECNKADNSQEKINDDVNKIWYHVKDILKCKFEDIYNQILEPNDWLKDSLAIKNLTLLYKRLREDERIIYFEVEEESIDSVLDIFVRVNSGGTVLSKSDLLFSTIVSHWDEAREEIDGLLTAMNKIGEGFRFSNDFIMRACLYVMDMPVTLKVETFKKDSVLKIKDNWTKIKKALIDTVNLLVDFGFNYENIISYVAITPIVYYIFHGGKIDAHTRAELRKYIVVAQLKQIFGAASNSALSSIRDTLKSVAGKPFSMRDLERIRFTGDRYLRYSEEEIEDMFDTYELGAYTFMILSLLYPDLKYGQKGFHQDHMHPYVSFEEKNIKNLKLEDGTIINDSKKEEWRRRRNTLANLQMLESKDNVTKNATPLVDWLNDPINKTNVKYLPSNVSYKLCAFEAFLDARQKLMSEQLKKILL